MSGKSSPYTVEDTSSVVANGITASYDSDNPNKISTTTQLSDGNLKDYIYVYETYNDGSSNNSRITLFNYSADSNLFPSEYYEGIESEPYAKEITVEYGGSTAPVTITKINYVTPDSILGVSSPTGLPAQQARSATLNMDGLVVSIMYTNPFTMLSIPASVFPTGYFSPKYYDERGEEVYEEDDNHIRTPLLNITVKKVVLTFKYPGKPEASGTFNNITVNRIPIHTPIFDTDKGLDRNIEETEIPWNNGASVDLKSWDFGDLHKDTGDAPSPQIKVYKLVTGKEPELLSESFSDDDGGEYKIVDAGDGKKTVQFLTAGCRYRVDVTLSTEEDFQWDTPYNGKKTDSLTVSFEVQVEKGQPIVTLNDIINVMYGTPNANGKITATLEGEDMGDLPWTLSSNPNDKAYETQKDVWYYRLVYTDKNTGLSVTDLRSDGKPKNVGTYEVYAVTYENAGYKSATSDKLTFEITQFVINTGVNGPKEFNRVGYGIDEILTSTDSLPNSLDSTNYTEKITDI